MATTAAVNEFRRVLSNPEADTVAGQFDSYRGRYRYLWHYYLNSAFEELSTWSAYRGRYALYRHQRSIYNPARRLANFYAGIIYPGNLAVDASRLPDGTPLAIPFAEDTPEQLLAAVGQLWQWSNWQIGKSLMVRYGAALGDVLVEVVDDLESRKVNLEIVWPGLVTDLDLDASGNVKAYAIEYDYSAEDDSRAHTYRREIDQDSIRTFRDGDAYEYDGQPAEYANPYGFVPAVWCRHTNIGSAHGEPALRNIGKIDELNGLASRALDQAAKILAAPVIVAGDNITRLTSNQAKRGATEDLNNPNLDRESIAILKGSAGATVETLTMDPGEALAHMDRLTTEIEADHPELAMWAELREMSQVTGPGAARLFGDVAALVAEAAAEYDAQSVKLFQMGVAIAGWRASSGAWGAGLDRQRAKFMGYGLDSYQAGDLDMEIMPRPIVPETAIERLRRLREEQALEADRQGAQAIDPVAGIAARLAAVQTTPRPTLDRIAVPPAETATA